MCCCSFDGKLQFFDSGHARWGGKSGDWVRVDVIYLLFSFLISIVFFFFEFVIITFPYGSICDLFFLICLINFGC